MNKLYVRIFWADYPNDGTPLNERNLNVMDVGIDELDNRVINLDATKFDKSEAQRLVKEIEYDEKTGIFTVTHYNGASYTIDTLLEKLAVNFDYDYQTQRLIIMLSDGEIKYVDLSALITQYEFLDSDTIHFTISTDGKVSASVKEGSIEGRHLRPDYLADITVEASKAQASQEAAAASARESESFAHGGTGIRPGEDSDNAMAYSEKAKEYADSWKGSLLPQGSVAFSQLPTLGNVKGHMYNVNEAFETDARFKEGVGFSYPAGTNVYWTADGKWDCLSGVLTMEVTQAEYDALSNAKKMSGTIYYISDADNALQNASGDSAGLMSAADKNKLDGIAEGATRVLVDASLSVSSENPVQNKAVKAALDTKASLSSPSLTGTPTAPTAAAGTDSAQIATTAFVRSAIDALINGAPDTLDTLKEIADALAENDTVVAALNAAIGGKVDKVSGKGLSTNDYTTAEKNKLSGIAANANNYSLPAASTSARGGVKVGYAENGKNYPVELSDEKMFVNVPWTDTNTTYPFYSKSIDASFATKFRTETKGSATSGNYLSNVRTDAVNVSNAPQYGAGMAWGSADTHSYLNISYSSAAAYIGGGNADKLNWIKQLAFMDSNVASATNATNAVNATNSTNAANVNGSYTGSGGAQPPSYIPNGKVRFNMMNAFKGLSALSTYADCILMDTYTGGDVPYVTGFGILKTANNPRAFIAVGAKNNATAWAAQVELITTGNIGSQSVTSATKLTTSAGGSSTPVYFSGGKPVACTGIAKFRALTQAQYNALSSAEKNNNTIYFITDAK